MQQFARVEFLNLEENQMFDKVQSRKGKKARQVVSKAIIRMKAIYSCLNLCWIEAFAKRDEEAARLMTDSNDCMQLLKDKNTKLNLAENFDPDDGPVPIPEVIDGRQFLTVSRAHGSCEGSFNSNKLQVIENSNDRVRGLVVTRLRM